LIYLVPLAENRIGNFSYGLNAQDVQLMGLSKSTPDTILVWLVFTAISGHCGKTVVTRRLVEWNPESRNLSYVFPLERRRAVPLEGFTQGRPYYRLHQLKPEQKEGLIEACKAVSAIPMGVKVS
jgi:hypothetical protein